MQFSLAQCAVIALGVGVVMTFLWSAQKKSADRNSIIAIFMNVDDAIRKSQGLILQHNYYDAHSVISGALKNNLGDLIGIHNHVLPTPVPPGGIGRPLFGKIAIDLVHHFSPEAHSAMVCASDTCSRIGQTMPPFAHKIDIRGSIPTPTAHSVTTITPTPTQHYPPNGGTFAHDVTQPNQRHVVQQMGGATLLVDVTIKDIPKPKFHFICNCPTAQLRYYDTSTTVLSDPPDPFVKPLPPARLALPGSAAQVTPEWATWVAQSIDDLAKEWSNRDYIIRALEGSRDCLTKHKLTRGQWVRLLFRL